MAKNLVIVESPAKAKTIEGFLGKDYVVKSSFGHVRDLEKKDLGINIEAGFIPVYEISKDKKKVVEELSKLSKKADIIWLASDEDREGEAISWHLAEALHLPEDKTKRIVFNEITQTAILNAIKNPRKIDIDLVNAQQARRVLDRLVGFELSPILWKKVKPALSAGRVQSVAVRLIVEKEQAIKDFIPEVYYRVVAVFIPEGGKTSQIIKAELSERLKTKEEVIDFINIIKDGNFTVSSIETKPTHRTPPPPFTTSTLQQEASRKLGFSVTKTMTVAQQLYESGKITYMRTDSVNLSTLALGKAKEEIESKYGKKYSKTRNYTTKTKGAQEAHEAIRPTYINRHAVDGDIAQQKLYSLIWKRTIASQMADALIEHTTIHINSNKTDKYFIATGEVIKFDGFLKVYDESIDDDTSEKVSSIKAQISEGEKMDMQLLEATEKTTNPPFRYSEASLVKKLEELGIGRPSTYAPTITTIQNRGYVEKLKSAGTTRKFDIIKFKDNEITESIGTEKEGVVNGKLAPTDIGTIVNKFLVNNFNDILDYNFTASIEKQFDEIAHGKLKWQSMLTDFYGPFHTEVEKAEHNTEKIRGERLLGVDPESGKNVYVKLGRYGLMAQIGESEDEEKPRFTGLKKGQTLENVTFDDVMELFKFPKNVGNFENNEMIIGIGRFGPYIRHDNKFYSIPSTDEPLEISEERAIEIITEKRDEDSKKLIKTFTENPDIMVLNGRFGPYISFEKKNYKIPKTYKPEDISYSDCLIIIQKAKDKKAKK
ncbi:MAG: type I DNA topoisomerase [Bacteroidales bacterium]|jgi:DNA topoisomerase-1|nr:type I DNA topoisomerase [Bacteroidales bacterium]